MAEDSFVCSICCGQSRNFDTCDGCSFYKGDSQARNYRQVPFYAIQQLADSTDLQDIANVLESILCKFDLEIENNFTDKTALQLLELAFDKYHFKDQELAFNNVTLKTLFERMSQVIEEELCDIPQEQLVKVMASVYRSVQRRTNGGREYLIFIKQYVGARVGPGVRALSWPLEAR